MELEPNKLKGLDYWYALALGQIKPDPAPFPAETKCDLVEPVPAIKETPTEASRPAIEAGPAVVAPAPSPAELAPLFAGPAQMPVILASLAGTDVAVIDFETTAKTPYANPVKISPRATKIGDKTVKTLINEGCTISTNPRARILSIYLPDIDYLATVDLDLLTPAEKHKLAAALDGKIWVGHGLAFEYIWMYTLNPDCRPSRIIDTALLGITHAPYLIYEMQKWVIPNFGPPHILGPLSDYVSKRKTGGFLSLQSLCLFFLKTDLDKSYQMPENWTVDRLSPAHYEYCAGDVKTPLLIACRMLGLPDDSPVSAVLTRIDGDMGGPAYRVFESAMPALTAMHHNGIGWDAGKFDTLFAELKAEVAAAVDELLAVAPALKQKLDKLLDARGNADDDLRNILDALVEQETGHKLAVSGKSKKVSLDSKALKLSAGNSVIVGKYLAAKSIKTELRQLIEFNGKQAADSRFHAYTSIRAITGRTISENPSMQQTPRDPRFRALFIAKEGHKIIATDYSSVELRIAAALGVRAWRDFSGVRDCLAGRIPDDGRVKGNLSWIFKNSPDLVPYLVSDAIEVPPSLAVVPELGESPRIEDHGLRAGAELAHWVSRIRLVASGKEENLPFRAAYDRGVDPHLLTALFMLIRAGKFDADGKDALTYLSGLSKEETKALKNRFPTERQQAKAINFGALYGQGANGLWAYGKSSYGVDWTPAEAAEARSAWFELYPEIGLWHWLTKWLYVLKEQKIFNPYTRKPYELKQNGRPSGKLYYGWTLSGRYVVSADRKAGLNYQDQGTGAEIALAAIGALPVDVQRMLVNFVHDEIVLEAPDSLVDEVKAALESAMLQAAEPYLAPFGVRCEVETQIGDSWKH
ncbi:MAG: hypothetical protein K0041_07570 [Acidithiobacillus sp.]|nr:hypothetical protein [Acidithiobacillus sp.]